MADLSEEGVPPPVPERLTGGRARGPPAPPAPPPLPPKGSAPKAETLCPRCSEQVSSSEEVNALLKNAEAQVKELQAKMFFEYSQSLPWGEVQDCDAAQTIWDTEDIVIARKPSLGHCPVYFLKLSSNRIVVIKCIERGESARIFLADKIVQYLGVVQTLRALRT